MVRIKFKCFRLSTKSHHNKLKKIYKVNVQEVMMLWIEFGPES